MKKYYFERALFVVGEPNSGKSTQLKSMLLDVRFGTNSKIPPTRSIREVYRLSNERALYIRFTSPHEMMEFLRGRRRRAVNFLDKTENKMASNTPRLGRRWNFACALQPNAASNMPDVVATVRAFVRRFDPERTRLLFLSPDRHGTRLQKAHLPLVAGLRAIPTVEIAWIDARQRTVNGLLMADFFDFT